jgi:hypothetical protein
MNRDSGQMRGKRQGEGGNIAGQGRFYFDAYPVGGIVDAAATVVILSSNPVGANDGNQHLALLHFTFKKVAKVNTEGDGIDIKEDGIFAKMADQPVVDASGDVFAIAAAVGDKQFRYGLNRWLSPLKPDL